MGSTAVDAPLVEGSSQPCLLQEYSQEPPSQGLWSSKVGEEKNASCWGKGLSQAASITYHVPRLWQTHLDPRCPSPRKPSVCHRAPVSPPTGLRASHAALDTSSQPLKVSPSYKVGQQRGVRALWQSPQATLQHPFLQLDGGDRDSQSTSHTAAWLRAWAPGQWCWTSNGQDTDTWLSFS